MAFRNEEWGAGIAEVTSGADGSKSWHIAEVCEGNTVTVGGDSAGAYNVHTHPWAQGDEYPNAEGKIRKAVNPFHASRHGYNGLGLKDEETPPMVLLAGGTCLSVPKRE